MVKHPCSNKLFGSKNSDIVAGLIDAEYNKYKEDSCMDAIYFLFQKDELGLDNGNSSHVLKDDEKLNIDRKANVWVHRVNSV